MTDYARILFLESTFGNDSGDVVKVVSETPTAVYYNDTFRRWCYIDKAEEGTTYRYIKAGERLRR